MSKIITREQIEQEILSSMASARKRAGIYAILTSPPMQSLMYVIQFIFGGLMCFGFGYWIITSWISFNEDLINKEYLWRLPYYTQCDVPTVWIDAVRWCVAEVLLVMIAIIITLKIRLVIKQIYDHYIAEMKNFDSSHIDRFNQMKDALY